MSAVQRAVVSSYFTIFTSDGTSQTKKLSLIKRRRNAKMKRILAVLAVVMSSTIVEIIYGRHERTIWMNPRSSHWWEDVVLRNFGVRDWLENFRVSQETFHYLCQQLKPLIEKQSTVMRRPISVERRVAITLWILTTPSEYRSVAHLFGIARCTVCVIVRETCKAIVKKLAPLYVSFPHGESLKDVVKGFKERWGLPQCGGSIDGTHIPISAPAMNHTDYYNRKGWYSMVTQAVVDHNGLFRDLCIGWPGSVHDARVLSNSRVYRKINDGCLLQGDVL